MYDTDDDGREEDFLYKEEESEKDAEGESIQYSNKENVKACWKSWCYGVNLDRTTSRHSEFLYTLRRSQVEVGS